MSRELGGHGDEFGGSRGGMAEAVHSSNAAKRASAWAWRMSGSCSAAKRRRGSIRPRPRAANCCGNSRPSLIRRVARRCPAAFVAALGTGRGSRSGHGKAPDLLVMVRHEWVETLRESKMASVGAPSVVPSSAARRRSTVLRYQQIRDEQASVRSLQGAPRLHPVPPNKGDQSDPKHVRSTRRSDAAGIAGK